MISKHQKKNTIILAFVISVCLVLTLYSLGFISMLKKIVAATPSLPTSSSPSPSEHTGSQPEAEEQKTSIGESATEPNSQYDEARRQHNYDDFDDKHTHHF